MSDVAESWVAYVVGFMIVAVPTLLGLGAATVMAATGRAALAGDLFRVTVHLVCPSMLAMAAASVLFRLRWVFRRVWAALTGRAENGRGTRFGVELAGVLLFSTGASLCRVLASVNRGWRRSRSPGSRTRPGRTSPSDCRWSAWWSRCWAASSSR